MRQPFYRKDRQAWYVRTNGGKSQKRLAKTKHEAYEIWAHLQSLEDADSPNAAVAAVAELYLRTAERNLEPRTFDSYLYYIVSFCNLYGHDLVRNLKPFHVTRWLDEQPTWGNSSRRLAIASVKRSLNWAVEEGLIPKNPLASVKRPSPKRREALITDEQHRAMMMHCERHFRPVLVALKHSGCRPGEIAAVNTEDVHDGVWILNLHKTRKKTGKPKVVYLSPCLQSLSTLAAGRREGALFLNRNGERWTTNAIRCRFRRLREKLGLPAGTHGYAYRHSFTTAAIVNGVDVATVAELLGHSSTKMVDAHYSHLAEQREHLKDAARRAVG